MEDDGRNYQSRTNSNNSKFCLSQHHKFRCRERSCFGLGHPQVSEDKIKPQWAKPAQRSTFLPFDLSMHWCHNQRPKIFDFFFFFPSHLAGRVIINVKPQQSTLELKRKPCIYIYILENKMFLI